MCLHQPTHAPDPLIKIPPPLKPPHFLFSPRFILAKLTLTLKLKNYLPVIMIIIPNKMHNSKKQNSYMIKNLMQNLRSSSIPCHFRSKRIIFKNLHYTPKTRKHILPQHQMMNAFRKWAPEKMSEPKLRQKKQNLNQQ